MVIVWFNGPSARPFHHIPAQPLEIGCNFIERDRSVHHVCAYDLDVINRIQRREGCAYWTRAPMSNQHFETVPSSVEYSCSGTMALRLACHLTAEPIYIIGCDWELTNASIYDSAYRWRSHQPRKFTIARRQTLEQSAVQHQITMVTDRNVPYVGIYRIGSQDFLKLINC